MSQNKRLVKEYSRFVQDPPELITAKPNEANILEWHYIITGPPNTLYHNGRFATDTRICLSVSDYHQELWNPAWSVASILIGLLSFMVETTHTAGAIQSTDAEKKNLAISSRAFNQRSIIFRAMFSDVTSKEEGSSCSMFDEKRVAQKRIIGRKAKEKQIESSTAMSKAEILVNDAVVVKIDNVDLSKKRIRPKTDEKMKRVEVIVISSDSASDVEFIHSNKSQKS